MCDDAQALRELTRAIENPKLNYIGHTLEMIKQNPYLDPILDQPEFVAVRSRLGFRE